MTQGHHPDYERMLHEAAGHPAVAGAIQHVMGGHAPAGGHAMVPAHHGHGAPGGTVVHALHPEVHNAINDLRAETARTRAHNDRLAGIPGPGQHEGHQRHQGGHHQHEGGQYADYDGGHERHDRHREHEHRDHRDRHHEGHERRRPFKRDRGEVTRRRFPIGFYYQTIATGAVAEIEVKPQVNFQGYRLAVAPSVARYFNIVDIKVGKDSQLAATGELTAEAFSALAVGVQVELDCAEPGIVITLIVRNIDTAAGATQDFSAVLYGEVED